MNAVAVPLAPRSRLVLALTSVIGLLMLAWPPVFFAVHKVAPALSIIAAMIVCTVAGIFIPWRIRVVAALLLFPWLGWLMFAATLNFQIVTLNPDAETLAPTGASD